MENVISNPAHVWKAVINLKGNIAIRDLDAHEHIGDGDISILCNVVD